MEKKRDETVTRILEIGTTMLIEEGDTGISMRKVARETGISLSNLQYHFSNKQSLLLAIGDKYFRLCLGYLDEHLAENNHVQIETFLRHLVDFHFQHIFPVGDTCRVFREMWSISTKNEAVAKLVQRYYQQSRARIIAALENRKVNKTNSIKLANFFIAFIEGYSITGEAFVGEQQNTADDLFEALCLLVNKW